MKISEVIPEMMEPALPSPSRKKSRPMRRKVKINRVCSAISGLFELNRLLNRGIHVDGMRRMKEGREVGSLVRAGFFDEGILNEQ